MAKRLCISVKNDEYIEIESIAKQEGLKPIDIINRRIFDSKKGDTIDLRLRQIEDKILEHKNKNDSMFLELKGSILEIKSQIDSLKNSISNSLKLISHQTSFSKDYSSLNLGQVKIPEGATVESYRNSLEKRSADFSEKVFNEFLK